MWENKLEMDLLHLKMPNVITLSGSNQGVIDLSKKCWGNIRNFIGRWFSIEVPNLE